MTTYILIGIPGSGKSTFIQTMIENNVKHAIVSSDEIRAFVYGDATVQGKIWSTFFGLIQTHLTDNKVDNLYIDTTACNAKDRRNLVNFIRSHAIGNVHIVGVYLNTPLSVCKERNANRTRVVPESVINKMYQMLSSSPPVATEFDEFKVI
jgi:predicted kinase